jgi:hypothetical protein
VSLLQRGNHVLDRDAVDLHACGIALRDFNPREIALPECAPDKFALLETEGALLSSAVVEPGAVHLEEGHVHVAHVDVMEFGSNEADVLEFSVAEAHVLKT